MANPVLIKAAAMLLTDKRTWKAIGAIIAAVLSPIILLVTLFLIVTGTGAEHNRQTVAYCFNDRLLPITVTGEQRTLIGRVRGHYDRLDGAMDESEETLDDQFDRTKVKTMFLCLYLTGGDRFPANKYGEFIGCFIAEKAVRSGDETITVKCYNGNLDEVIQNIRLEFGVTVVRSQIEEIYNYIIMTEGA